MDEVHISDLSSWCNIDFNGVSNPLYQGAYLYINQTLISDLVIPSDVKEIKSLAFHGYHYLKSVSIPSNVTTIGKEAFQSCSGLYSITIPKSVTKIEEAAFAGCNLISIVVESENKIYDSRDNCNAIIETSTNTLITAGRNTKIPNTVTAIGNYAFYGIRLLKSVTIPNSVVTLGKEAFFNCYELEDITIGSNVKMMDTACFGNCYNLWIVNIQDLSSWCNIDFKGASSNPLYSSNSYKGGYLKISGSIIRDLAIPSNINEIKKYTFINCIGLTSVIVPASVYKINESAFSGCTNLSNAYLYSNLDLNSANFPETTKLHLTLNDNDKIDFDASIANTYADLTYNRELAAGKYGTIMLPFIPDAESLDNFAFFALSSVDGNTLIFDEVQSPEANTPYLYRLRSGKEATKITGDEMTISSTIASPNISGWETIGSFSNQTIDCSAGDAYYYAINANDNMLYNVVSKLNVKPYRAYFKGAMLSASKLIIRTADNETTMIDAVEVEDLAPIFYDLSGRQVVSPSKGIYIKNGKKVVVK
ncbi:MAG: leucine-rich repeat domain-containing protein [Prevotella sp.]|nr:leucine-rich repeat domain-containing protein [Prevotella sp.]